MNTSGTPRSPRLSWPDRETRPHFAGRSLPVKSLYAADWTAGRSRAAVARYTTNNSFPDAAPRTTPVPGLLADNAGSSATPDFLNDVSAIVLAGWLDGSTVSAWLFPGTDHCGPLL